MVGLTDDDGELMAVLRKLCTSPPSYIMRGEESNVLVDIHEPGDMFGQAVLWRLSMCH